MTDSLLPLSDIERAAIDDCWNRIGVQGDKSCERLVQHIHCRNCEVHASLATRLLDRFALQRDEDEPEHEWVEEESGERRSILIFRVGEAWLALATRALSEVATRTSIHSLPHQRSLGLMGVTNVRGALVACVSLAEMLGLESAEAVTERRVVPRMLIFSLADGPVVMPVDEVEGIEAIAVSQVVETGNGSVPMARRFASGVLQWKGRSVTLLDEQILQQTIARSLG
ncbi:chemotaxis-related protein WspD [Pseudomonas sp. BIGb0408]|uniref:Chemotaxis protein CheW n=1 Tax=Phytopseudomonas flavescens TaxID=29435 RepID=A0A7Y9XQF3_9GAMM|nr:MULTISPECIES: chemotaxis protein CheW [Pseudomonas]MCW2291140.1 chemotaxis-related protein WspD [Pseudomonas sp. BIGb0408]NYH74289.1 chemotaxis-related protein WspD [Pseudomonas flavescens]